MGITPPPEWAPQRAIWTAWPSAADLWLDDLAPARAEVAALVRALAGGVPVQLLCATDEAHAAAEAALGDAATLHRVAFGDIWLRDTGPIFLSGYAAHGFRFNGWGGKYDLAHDDTVGAEVAALAGASLTRHDWVLEGGAIDHDGTGLAVTTEQCLLNPNRNPGLPRREVERLLGDALGFHDLLWLGDGLLNDHTDGHVDNLARFVAPGVLALPVATTENDPNAAVFADARARAKAAGLEVAELPSVGLFERDGDVVPASYMNFVIANDVVAVPLYGAPNDAAAVTALEGLFPGRRVAGLRADHVLTGGGSFHCITQQQPE